MDATQHVMLFLSKTGEQLFRIFANQLRDEFDQAHPRTPFPTIQPSITEIHADYVLRVWLWLPCNQASDFQSFVIDGIKAGRFPSEHFRLNISGLTSTTSLEFGEFECKASAPYELVPLSHRGESGVEFQPNEAILMAKGLKSLIGSMRTVPSIYGDYLTHDESLFELEQSELHTMLESIHKLEQLAGVTTAG